MKGELSFYKGRIAIRPYKGLFTTFGIAGEGIKYLVHGMGVELFFELGRAVHRLYPTVYHDTDTMAVLGFVHIVGGHKYGDALCGGFVYHIPELSARYRVYATGRLVEKDDFGTVEDSHREGELLLPAER